MSLPSPLITRLPDRLSGAAVFADTRVPVQTLIDSRPLLMHTRPTSFRTLATTFVLAGCSVFDPGDDVCTLIGCQSGLRVELSARPAGPFRVEVAAPGAAAGGPTYVFECADPTRCAAGAFFTDFTPSRVTVRVTTPAGVVTRDFTPAYRTYNPNGEDCEPTCREATVRVEL